MENRFKGFASWDGQSKHEFVTQQAQGVLNTLLAAGANFYSYLGQEIMYVNGSVIDLVRRSELYLVLDQMQIPRLPYARDVALEVRYLARPLSIPIPERTLGTVKGVKEPKLRMSHYLRLPIRLWIKEVINSGILVNTTGEQKHED